MYNKNHKIAKILIMIPIIVFAVAATCLIPLTISYFSTGSDVTAMAIIISGTFILITTTLPCLVISVVGTVTAARSQKEGYAASSKIFIIGIIETAVYSIGMLCAIAVVILLVSR